MTELLRIFAGAAAHARRESEPATRCGLGSRDDVIRPERLEVLLRVGRGFAGRLGPQSRGAVVLPRVADQGSRTAAVVAVVDFLRP